MTFIGPEYIIAQFLIALNKIKKQNNVSLKKLNSFCIYAQKEFNRLNVNAILFCSNNQIITTINNYSDYFKYNNNNIYLNENKDINDLEARFTSFLPINVLWPLYKKAKEFIAGEQE